MPQLKLFCLPPAGGSSTTFKGWGGGLHEDIEIIPVEYPGRGRRTRDSPYVDISDAVDDVFAFVEAQRASVPYALFGHSMGSLIAFELARRTKRGTGESPQLLIASGLPSPDSIRPSRELQCLPDAEFIERVIEFGGVPPALAANRTLLRLFLPLLRADHLLYENYAYVHGPVLGCDVIVLHGLDDPLTKDRVTNWPLMTSGSTEMVGFSGGHFFLNDFDSQIVKTINRAVAADRSEAAQ